MTVTPYHSLRPGDVLDSPGHGRAVVLGKVRWNSTPRHSGGWVLDIRIIAPGPESALSKLPEERWAYPFPMAVAQVEAGHQVDPNAHIAPSSLRPDPYYPPVPTAFLGGDTISYGDGIGWTRDHAGAWTMPQANGAGPVVDDFHASATFTGNESLRQLGAPDFIPAMPTLDTLPPLAAWAPLPHAWYYVARSDNDGALVPVGGQIRTGAEVSSVLYRFNREAIRDAGAGRIVVRGEYRPGQVTVMVPAS
ncbi:hypothetical protein [Streptomyces niveus]|uniref:hypothetical protein n=1 Tax=Streptomyces niveus TaxID=193462 RepID=UPI00342A0E32